MTKTSQNPERCGPTCPNYRGFCASLGECAPVSAIVSANIIPMLPLTGSSDLDYSLITKSVYHLKLSDAADSLVSPEDPCKRNEKIDNLTKILVKIPRSF